MNGHFDDDQCKADCKDIENFEVMEAWEVVDITDEMNFIESTWDFKLKRFPDGLIKKSRLLVKT